MTKEEVINQLQDAKDGYEEFLTDEALDMAIQAIQALAQIKAEIEDLEPDYGNTGYGFESYYKCQSEVLKIIDKHIGGKE